MSVEVEDEDDPIDCVVKLDAMLTMPPAEHLREWLAAVIGRRLGVVVPEAFEVTIEPGLAEAVDGFPLRSALRAAVHPVYGSRLVVGVAPPKPNETLSVEIRAEAAELLAFDVFIHNVDRRAVNPNVFVKRSKVIAFDHGDAFGFLLPILGGSNPVTSPLIDEVVRPHVFARSFGPRSGIALQRLRDAIADLDDDFFAALRSATPSAWTDRLAAGMVERVCSILQQRRDAVDLWLPQVETWILK